MAFTTGSIGASRMVNRELLLKIPRAVSGVLADDLRALWRAAIFPLASGAVERSIVVYQGAGLGGGEGPRWA